MLNRKHIEEFVRICSARIKKENENRKTITYKMKFTDSVSFMSNSRSNLADKLVKGLHKDKRKNFKSSI